MDDERGSLSTGSDGVAGAGAAIRLAPSGSRLPRRAAAAAATRQPSTSAAKSPVPQPAPGATPPMAGPRRKPVVNASAPRPLYRPAASGGARSLMIAGRVGDSRLSPRAKIIVAVTKVTSAAALPPRWPPMITTTQLTAQARAASAAPVV